MTPAARIAATIEILDEIAQADSPADAILANWFRNHRFAGSKDRRGVRELVYRDLRKGSLLRWLCTSMDADPTSARVRVILASEQEGAGTAHSRFDGSKYGPEQMSIPETEYVAALHATEISHAPTWVNANCPEHLFPLFFDQWGDTAIVEAAALNERAPVDLRVNTLKNNREAAQAALLAAGYETEPTPFSTIGLRGTEHSNFSSLEPFKTGMVEPQDESSQLVAQLVDAKPGMQVIDLCAGAGGKALALSAMMENQGEVVACDTLVSRLTRMGPRRDRIGANNLRTLPVQTGIVPDELVGWGDRVLVDAPCSGSGTWRRSPELRWRTDSDIIAAYTATQSGLLATAASMVKPGGRLIYAVCSVFDAEGRDVAQAFEASHAEFKRVPIADVLGAEGAEALNACEEIILTPHRHATDGMYAAVFERAA